MPLSMVRPARAARSVFGTAPTPATTTSPSIVVPSLRWTRVQSPSSRDGRDADTASQVDAFRHVARRHHRRHLAGDDAAHDLRRHLDDGNLAAALARARRDLEPDEPAADHDEPGARCQHLAQAGGVGIVFAT